MSSSSSSASTPAPVKGTSTTYSSTSSSSYASSSSVSSWAVLKSDAEEDHVANNKPSLQPQPPAAMSSITSMDIIHQPSDHNGIDDVSCMDVMETFGYMDLMNPNSEIWDDPSSIFENAENPLDFQQFHQQLQSPSPSSSSSSSQQIVVECGGDVHEGETSEDLAMVFFEWLKKNKESISAEDLRNVRLKRSTIESAAKRLGGGKEGMKRLLKLVLEWVQNHQLHKGIRRMVPNPCFSPSPLNIPHQSPPQPPPYVIDGMASGPGFPSMVGYMGDPPINSNPYVFDSAVAWPPSPMAMPSPPPQDFSGDGNQCNFQQFPGKGEKLVRLGSSATKEARQKRMARQRRFLSHHHRHNQQQYQIAADQQATLIGSDNCTNAAAAQTNPANWVYWPSATVPVSPSPPVLQPDTPVQSQSFSWSDL